MRISLSFFILRDNLQVSHILLLLNSFSTIHNLRGGRRGNFHDNPTRFVKTESAPASAISDLHVRGEPPVCADQFLRVILDPGRRDDHHVLQDLQGGNQTESCSQ